MTRAPRPARPDAFTPRWVGTWASAAQLTEPQNLPPSPGLSHNTLRQIVQVSIGGERLRVLLSNAFGNGPLTVNGVGVANAASDHSIDTRTLVTLSFGGRPSVTIPAGGTARSDAFSYSLAPLSQLGVTLHFGDVPNDVTGHPGSRTTSYLVSGDASTAAMLPSSRRIEHWYVLTGIDVETNASPGAVVTLGDSITDGRGSSTDGNNRWPDCLARRLHGNAATASVAVLNLGLGGNAVLSGGLGPTAVQRFERDVLEQPGVRWVIILNGVNDIGGSSGQGVVAKLIAAFERFVERAHEHGVLAYGVPILPFGGSDYDSPEHEAVRQTVNNWIRASGKFDAVIDLDAAVRDPANPTRLLAAYDSGDHLHLSVAGYAGMAEAVDLRLFV